LASANSCGRVMSSPINAPQYGTLHDLQFDTIGNRLATATSDRIVRIWTSDQEQLLSELRGHKAPVLTLSWAPSLPLLASGAADGHVILWREFGVGEWKSVHEIHVAESLSVVTFCPAQYGCMLAIAGMDSLGVVTVLVRRGSAQAANEHWSAHAFPAHEGGVASVSWSAYVCPAALASGPAVSRAMPRSACRLATCGVDGIAFVWSGDLKQESWRQEQELILPEQLGAVCDVAWRPNLGVPSSMLAMCTVKDAIVIWAQDFQGDEWRLRCSWMVQSDLRRLSWSKTGALLAASFGETGSLLYKEVPGGNWEQVHSF